MQLAMLRKMVSMVEPENRKNLPDGTYHLKQSTILRITSLIFSLTPEHTVSEDRITYS